MENIDHLSVSGPGDVPAGNWFIRFAEVDRAISRTTDEQLDLLFGISAAQAKAIACLAHQPSMTQVQLAHRLHYDLASVSRLMARLVDAGIAVRRRNAHDRRCWCISLTGHGMGMVADTVAVLKAVDRRSTRDLTDDELHLFVALLRRILGNAAAHPAEMTAGVTGVADEGGEWPAAPDFYSMGRAVGW